MGTCGDGAGRVKEGRVPHWAPYAPHAHHPGRLLWVTTLFWNQRRLGQEETSEMSKYSPGSAERKVHVGWGLTHKAFDTLPVFSHNLCGIFFFLSQIIPSKRKYRW